MIAAADVQWKGYSLAERDWRWQRVRESAAQAGLDCIFLPHCVDGKNLHLSLEQARGTRSDSRFLTQMENASIVLPTDGRTPIAINAEGSGNSWIPETRPVENSWGQATAQALEELRMERARIGVIGLGRGKVTHGRAAAGVVNHTSYAEVLRRFPNAKFEHATDVVGYARYVKTEEQIACLKRGASIAAAGIEEMIKTARPGVAVAHLYARVMRRMVELGSEYYPMAFYTAPLESGARLPRYEDPPIGVKFEPMYHITNEVDAVWGSLIAQELQPMILGPLSDEWKALVELQRDLFYGGLERMKPGTSFAELIEFTNTLGPKRGLKSLILMHGRGYGDDGPLLTPQDTTYERAKEVIIEKGNVFVWKPIAMNSNEKIQMSWGGCVVITDKGGEPLIQRTHQMVSIL